MKKIFILFFLFPFFVNAELSDQQHLVDKACLTLKSLLGNPNYCANIKNLMSRAYGVIVIPSYYKAGFLVGGEGGTGVVLIKNRDGTWSNPSFVTAVGGSFGLQIGVESAELLLIVMSEKGMRNLTNDSFTLGANVSIAAGPLGGGLSTQTTANMDVDIFSFSHSMGLFGGGALNGTVIKERCSWNEAYYRAGANSESILRSAVFNQPGAVEIQRFLLSIPSIPVPAPAGGKYIPPQQMADAVPQGMGTPQDEPMDLAKMAAENKTAPAPAMNAPVTHAPMSSSSQGPRELLPWNKTN